MLTYLVVLRRFFLSKASLRDGAIYDVAMVLAARALLRLQSPLHAHATLLRLGRWLPLVETADDARRVALSLNGHGTCLSRSLAIAARTPGADVVISVAPGKGTPLSAHAWVEMDGVPIVPSDVAGTVIARIRGRARLQDKDETSAIRFPTSR